MSRMTILDSSLWVSLTGAREPGGSAKMGSGYPPYNI